MEEEEPIWVAIIMLEVDVLKEAVWLLLKDNNKKV
jgi:hypothetical protein